MSLALDSLGGERPQVQAFGSTGGVQRGVDGILPTSTQGSHSVAPTRPAIKGLHLAIRVLAVVGHGASSQEEMDVHIPMIPIARAVQSPFDTYPMYSPQIFGVLPRYGDLLGQRQAVRHCGDDLPCDDGIFA